MEPIPTPTQALIVVAVFAAVAVILYLRNDKMSKAALFYVQDTRDYVSNSMLWWKNDNCGYVCDIQKAKVFTQKEIDEMQSCKKGGNKRAWPKEYIDERISHHIDMQDTDFTEAEKTIE